VRPPPGSIPDELEAGPPPQPAAEEEDGKRGELDMEGLSRSPLPHIDLRCLLVCSSLYPRQQKRINLLGCVASSIALKKLEKVDTAMLIEIYR